MDLNYKLNRLDRFMTRHARIIGFVFALGLVLTAFVLGIEGQGQEAPKTQETPNNLVSKPTPKPVVDPMDLTQAEIDVAQGISKDIIPLNAELQRAYREIVQGKTASERHAAADQLWIAVKQMEPLQKRQDDWILGVRKARNCDNCIIEGNRVVKPKTVIAQ